MGYVCMSAHECAHDVVIMIQMSQFCFLGGVKKNKQEEEEKEQHKKTKNLSLQKNEKTLTKKSYLGQISQPHY